MPIDRLDSTLTPSASGPPDLAPNGGRTAAPAQDSASRPDATDRLRALADAFGVGPDELLAHLQAMVAGQADVSSPASAAVTALRNPDDPAHAWASDLTRHRSGLLVDITV